MFRVLVVQSEPADATITECLARFRSIFEDNAVGRAFVARDGRFLEVNQEFGHILGHGEAELLNARLQSLVHPEDPDPECGFFDELWSGRVKECALERRLVHRRGHSVWALIDVLVIRDERDVPTHFTLGLRDITQRRATEDELRRSREESRIVLETANDAFLAMDTEGRVRDWNRCAERMFGWRRDEVIGRPLEDTLLRAAHRDGFRR